MTTHALLPRCPAGRAAERRRQPVDRTIPAARRLLVAVGRAFARHWWIELSVFAGLFAVYNVVRALPHSGATVALAHAHGVLDLESAVYGHLELPLNTWLAGVPALAIPACYFYAVFHYAATPVVFLLSRRRGGWAYWRGYWSLVLASATALASYALFPTAPPRLVPGLGSIDVLARFSSYGWWGGAASAPRGIGDATNQFAAMPSMHFGWALWCAIMMWGFGGRVWRILAVLYPSVLLVVVLGTGNHFLADVVAGAACTLAALAAVQVLGRLWRRAARPSSVPAAPASLSLVV